MINNFVYFFCFLLWFLFLGDWKIINKCNYFMISCNHHSFYSCCFILLSCWFVVWCLLCYELFVVFAKVQILKKRCLWNYKAGSRGRPKYSIFFFLPSFCFSLIYSWQSDRMRMIIQLQFTIDGKKKHKLLFCCSSYIWNGRSHLYRWLLRGVYFLDFRFRLDLRAFFFLVLRVLCRLGGLFCSFSNLWFISALKFHSSWSRFMILLAVK